MAYPEITNIVSTSINSDIHDFYSESNIQTIMLKSIEIFEKDKTVEPSTNIAYETTVINNLINKCTIYKLLNGLCNLDSNDYDAIVSILSEFI